MVQAKPRGGAQTLPWRRQWQESRAILLPLYLVKSQKVRHSDAMKLKLIKIKSKEADVKVFEKKEWAKANKEHYRKLLNWKQKEYSAVAFDREEIVGIIDATVQAGVMYVKMVIVSENYRKKGAGEMLMRKMEMIARKQKAHKIYLHTGKSWGAATTISYFVQNGLISIICITAAYYLSKWIIRKATEGPTQ